MRAAGEWTTSIDSHGVTRLTQTICASMQPAGDGQMLAKPHCPKERSTLQIVCTMLGCLLVIGPCMLRRAWLQWPWNRQEDAFLMAISQLTASSLWLYGPCRYRTDLIPASLHRAFARSTMPSARSMPMICLSSENEFANITSSWPAQACQPRSNVFYRRMNVQKS